jgi:hypothetical protein
MKNNIIHALTDSEVATLESFLFGNGHLPGLEAPQVVVAPHQVVITEVIRRLALPFSSGRGCRNVVRSSPYERPIKETVSTDANEFFKTIWVIMHPTTEFVASNLEHTRTKNIILQIYKERS